MKIRCNMLKKYSVRFSTAVIFSVVALTAISAERNISLGAKNSCEDLCLEQKALLGDGKIAYEIGNSYMYKDREKMKFWYRISAENGNASGQHNYAHFLAVDSKRAEDCYRAIFWFSMAARKGDSLSKNYRKKLLSLMSANSNYKHGCSIQYQSSL
jgi:TPR repeat protein